MKTCSPLEIFQSCVQLAKHLLRPWIIALLVMDQFRSIPAALTFFYVGDIACGIF